MNEKPLCEGSFLMSKSKKAVQISIPSIFWFLACSEAIFVTFFLTLLMELDYFRVHKSFTAVANGRTIGSAAANSST